MGASILQPPTNALTPGDSDAAQALARVYRLVSALEGRIAILERTQVVPPTKPKSALFKQRSTALPYTVTYASNGGYLTVVAFINWSAGAGGATIGLNLLTDGNVRDNLQDALPANDNTMGVLMYNSGSQVSSGNHSVSIDTDGTGVGWFVSQKYILVIEQAYS